MNEELKPCPFCGSDDVVVYSDHGAWRGACLDCDSEGRPTGEHERAVEAWNSRTSPALIGLPVIDPDLLDTSKEAV